MYKCLKCEFPKVERKIKTIIKKLNKFNVPYVYEIKENSVEPVKIYEVDSVTQTKYYIETRNYECVNYIFEMNQLKLGDWKVIAHIHHNVGTDTDGKYINHISMVDTSEKVNPKWYHIESKCEHCNTNRYRSHTIIIKNSEGEIKQIGSTCVKDFTGIDGFDIIKNYSDIYEIILKESEFVECGYSGDGQQYSYFRTIDYLAACIKAIKECGGYHNRQYDYSQTEMSTATQAAEFLHKQILIESGYKTSAEDVIKYFTDLYNNEKDSSDFETQTCTALMNEYTKADGRIAYAFELYNRLIQNEKQEELKKSKAGESEYVGQKGDRIEVNVTCESVHWYDGFYGTTWIYTFRTNDSNVLVWRTSTLQDIEVDSQYKIKGTIKFHNIYNYEKQTEITRCKVISL